LSTFPAGCISFASSKLGEDEILSEEVMYIAFLSECFEKDRLARLQL